MSGLRNPQDLDADTLMRLVDALVWPLLLLRPDGKLLHANAPARAALAAPGPLRIGPWRRVRAADARRQPAWQAALAAATAGQRHLLCWAGTATLVPLALRGRAGRAAEGGPLILVAIGAGGPSGVAAPAAAEAPAKLPMATDTGAYARAHGLTGAQARVLQHLARGDSPAQTAAALQVSVATVRSQVAAVRQKTGHLGTAALIGAAARSAPRQADAIVSAAPPSAAADADVDAAAFSPPLVALNKADAAARDEGLARLLDELACGLVLVDAQAQVHACNQAALPLLGGTHPLMRSGAQLQARDVSDQAGLLAALAAAGRGQRGLLSLGPEKPAAQVSVVPLPGEQPPRRFVLVLDAPRAALPAAVLDLARGLGLTPAEARVLALLCEGRRPAEIASRQGVAISTVRSQIAGLRHKAGAASIRDLVRQVALLPPLA